MNLDALESDLMTDEGFRGVPYLDTVGKLTVGFGRNLVDKPLTRAEAAWLLRNDVTDTMHSLDSRFPWWRTLDDVRQSVMVNMAYNLGTAKLGQFVKCLAALKSGDYVTAAAEMRDSTWARQVGARATLLARQMETGTR